MLDIGTVIFGKYRIDRKLTLGGMSDIYQGSDVTGKVYCIKEAKNDAISVEALKEEAGILSQMDHCGVPRFYEAFEWKGHYIIVMELIQGITLGELVEKRGSVSEAEVIEWTGQICEILSYIHNFPQPIIHRDIKPSNIIVRSDGTIALIDFGIAREFKVGKLQDTRGLGTKGYAAPEQYGGKGQTDPRTDIYSYGSTMFYLLSGKNPMDVQQEFPMVRKINPEISVEMENIICKCTKTFPQERYQSAAELMEDIEMMKNHESSETWSLILSLALGFAGIALIAYEIVIGVLHTSVFIIGGVLLTGAIIISILRGLFRKQSISKESSSKKHSVFLQQRDNLGTGNVSGKKSGDMKNDEGRGILIEDTVRFLAADDWVSVLGQK